MADKLVTVAQVKSRLGITDAGSDAVLGEIVEQVTSEIQSYIGRRLIAEAATTYYLDTREGHEIAVPRGIRTVTYLGLAETDQPDDGTGTYTAQTLTNVLLRPAAALRRTDWPPTRIVLTQSTISVNVPLLTVANGAKITGDWDFAAVPIFVQRIAIAASVAEFLDRRRSGKAGPDEISLPGLLDPSQLAALARLRAGAGVGIG